MREPIFLDHMSSTPLDPKVKKSMLDAMDLPHVAFSATHQPSAEHIYIDQLVGSTQSTLADMVGTQANRVIFTSGATEANNIALRGSVKRYQQQAFHIITTKTEHHATLATCRYLEKKGVTVTYLTPSSKNGRYSLDQFHNAISPNTQMISISHANNENGNIIDLKAIGELCEQNNLLLHVDAAQSFGKLPIDMETMNIDFLSISAHKIYGPKGIGALLCRKTSPAPHPILFGGGQQNGIRPGTLAPFLIAGFGAAAGISRDAMDSDWRHNEQLTRCIDATLSTLPGYHRHGDLTHRLSHHMSIYFENIHSQALKSCLPHLTYSQKSACQAGLDEPSHVLLAMGYDEHRAKHTLRLSTGRFTSLHDVQHAANDIKQAVIELRELLP